MIRCKFCDSDMHVSYGPSMHGKTEYHTCNSCKSVLKYVIEEGKKGDIQRLKSRWYDTNTGAFEEWSNG